MSLRPRLNVEKGRQVSVISGLNCILNRFKNRPGRNRLLRRWLLHFCVLTAMFNYVNFHKLILASQMQFSFVLMHILNDSWCGPECTEEYYSVCLVRYTENLVIVRETIPLY